MILFFLFACSQEPVNYEQLAIEMGETGKTLIDSLFSYVDEQGVELWYPEENGVAWQGSPGEVLLGINITSAIINYEQLDDYESTWSVPLEVSFNNPDLNEEITGTSTWNLEKSYYDYENLKETFTGEIVIREETLEVNFEAYFSGNLHWVEGNFGNELINWVNPEPDLCK